MEDPTAAAAPAAVFVAGAGVPARPAASSVTPFGHPLAVPVRTCNAPRERSRSTATTRRNPGLQLRSSFVGGSARQLFRAAAAPPSSAPRTARTRDVVQAVSVPAKKSRSSSSSPERARAPSRPELLAPAGNWDCARAAVENGADAIYFGLDQFNARLRADNFTEADLPGLMQFLHSRGVKGYVTLNTLAFTTELPDVEKYLRSVIAAGVDALIVQDVGVCKLIRHLSPDFPIHASTQMTVTSDAGVQFAEALGCSVVVLARECTIGEIAEIQRQSPVQVPLEVFVHGALCVAYSGQCLTSEALGGRSANRGECAQACRMQYRLLADGKEVDLGGREYLLSPQDLCGAELLPQLVAAGVSSLKIEGRLKTPEYVASVVRVYREALDRAAAAAAPVEDPREAAPQPLTAAQRYELEMAFSRGLSPGWLAGIDNQRLVHARFGKKRGARVGVVRSVDARARRVVIGGVEASAALKPGDGVVFDAGRPAEGEPGGFVYEVEPGRARGSLVAAFGPRTDVRRVRPGDIVWKTSDPALSRALRKSWAPARSEAEAAGAAAAGEASAGSGTPVRFRRPIEIEVRGRLGEPLSAVARDPETGVTAAARSEGPLEAARSRPLTRDSLLEQLGRLGNTPFALEEGGLESAGLDLAAGLALPVSELNRLRRALVESLEAARAAPRRWSLAPPAAASYRTALRFPEQRAPGAAAAAEAAAAEIVPLVRSGGAQLRAALEGRPGRVYLDVEDPRAYAALVPEAREISPGTEVFVAPPRIFKPNERWILEQVARGGADGYLVRNYEHLRFFGAERGARMVADFSFNVANPLSAAHFLGLPRADPLGGGEGGEGARALERLTASYDLSAAELVPLLEACPPGVLEVTLHQRIPMFHMEHCVFCAFLSEGKDFRDCGRPCEAHAVELEDRVGTRHTLKGDAGCRNTVYNGRAQTGAEHFGRLAGAGARAFRVEFVDEGPGRVRRTLECYGALARGELSGADLWRELKLLSQLGVTRGSME
eukprot:tig00020685_g12972.t1